MTTLSRFVRLLWAWFEHRVLWRSPIAPIVFDDVAFVPGGRHQANSPHYTEWIGEDTLFNMLANARHYSDNAVIVVAGRDVWQVVRKPEIDLI